MNIQSFQPMNLGDAHLDREHAELFRLVGALFDASSSEAVAALDSLRTEMREHFGREDADLRRLGGNNAECHLDEHAAVLKSLDEVHLILGETATTPATAQRLVSSLSLELLHWLPEHVSEMDANLAAVRSKARFGGVPMTLLRRKPGA
ncbi:hemerythrin-like metal-binding domain protein [Polaromonas sp. OV174]|uniref:hemerythrin family protein n=1 Tax=Polaromonas sp. OV174 TaxID=1855300 RepID=UPI0008F42F16|nr:hemerythrin family protein [Polaromonas sp. OV174]SFC60493.1 hemerythrin-like metal-binding domain protein [Polaromonas sp. OV174]